MDAKKINVALKSLVFLLAILGAVFTFMVVKGGNPFSYETKDIVAAGTQKAIEQGKDKELSQVALDKWIMNEGLAYKTEREQQVQSNVDLLINYTVYLLIAIVVVLLWGTVSAILINPKKQVVSLIGIGAFLLLFFVIYMITSGDVPSEFVQMEAKEIADNPNYNPVYTASNWKMVSVAFTTTMVLGVIAILAWLAGSVMKAFK